MNKTSKEHYRNRSQLHIYTSSCSLKEKKKLRSSLETQNINAKSCKNSKSLGSQTIRSLINKSTRKANKKRVVVEQIENSGNSSPDKFFCFGKGIVPQKIRLPLLEMQQIMEVPDTGSYSQRNTDQNKQNLRDLVNRQVQFLKTDQYFRHNLPKKPLPSQKMAAVSIMSQRQKRHRDLEIEQIESKSYSKSNQVIECSRNKDRKSKSKSKISRLQQRQKLQLTALRQKTKRLQQNFLLVWQCMGEIIQKNETIKHNSEQNTRKIDDLLKKDQQRQTQLLEMKLQYMKKEKKPLRF